MHSKDWVTNTSTALMAIKDLATYNDIPIDIHFEDGCIRVVIGGDTSKSMGFHTQDTYKYHSRNDDIYEWIEKRIAEIKGEIKNEQT